MSIILFIIFNASFFVIIFFFTADRITDVVLKVSTPNDWATLIPLESSIINGFFNFNARLIAEFSPFPKNKSKLLDGDLIVNKFSSIALFINSKSGLLLNKSSSSTSFVIIMEPYSLLNKSNLFIFVKYIIGDVFEIIIKLTSLFLNLLHHTLPNLYFYLLIFQAFLIKNCQFSSSLLLLQVAFLLLHSYRRSTFSLFLISLFEYPYQTLLILCLSFCILYIILYTI